MITDFYFVIINFHKLFKVQFKIIYYRDVKDNFELLHRAISL